MNTDKKYFLSLMGSTFILKIFGDAFEFDDSHLWRVTPLVYMSITVLAYLVFMTFV